MFGCHQILPGSAVHAVCPLALEDDVAYTSGILNAPPHVLLAAKNNTVEVYALDLPAEGDASSAASSPCSSSPSSPSSACSSVEAADALDTSAALRSLGHAVDFGCPVLAMAALAHQCIVVWTAEQELVVLRYQANLPGGREDLIGQGPSCTTSLEKLKKGLPCTPRSLDWTAEAGQHWAGLHHRLHWMVIHSTVLTGGDASDTWRHRPHADPQLVLLSRAACNVVVAHVYEGIVHRVMIAFNEIVNSAPSPPSSSPFADGRRPDQEAPVRVLSNFYSDRWTGLNVAANYTVSTIRAPEPFTSAGLSCAIKGESSAARRQRVEAQWASFSYQDIADEELLLQHSITELSAHKAQTAAHSPSWRVRRDRRLPTVSVETTKLREGHGGACLVPIPTLHNMSYPDTLQWVLCYTQRPHLCVYRHPAGEPGKMQCFQKPHARQEGCVAYLGLSVPATLTTTLSKAPSAAALLVLFQQTADGCHRVRVEALNTFRLGLETSTGTAVASCAARPVSGLALLPPSSSTSSTSPESSPSAAACVLWLALDDGTLSSVTLPPPTVEDATAALDDGADSGDCEPRPWPPAPAVRGLPADFRVRRLLPLHLAPASPASAEFLYAATSRYAIFEDQLAEAVVVDLVKLEVVAALRSEGAMTDVCEGLNGSLVAAHVGGQLTRLAAVAPTQLLARLYPSDATEERALVDGIFPLLLRTTPSADEDTTALHVLVSLDSDRSALYRTTLACASAVVSLTQLERVAPPLSESPTVALLTEAATLAAISTDGGRALVQCTATRLSAFGVVTTLADAVWHAALAAVDDGSADGGGAVAALVCASCENTVVLRALFAPSAPPAPPAPPTVPVELPMDSAVSAVAVSAVRVPEAAAAWRVCVLTALWDGRLCVHVLHHSRSAGWHLEDQRTLPPSAVASVVHQLVPVPSAASTSVWRGQWVATARPGGLPGAAAPAQLIDVVVQRRPGGGAELTTAQRMGMPSAEGIAGPLPPAQIAASALRLRLGEGSLSHVHAARQGGLHVALLHACYAELHSFGLSPNSTTSAADAGLPRPIASLRVDAHAAPDGSSDTHWRSCALVECTHVGSPSVTHVLLAASTEGGLAVVALPDVLVPTCAPAAPAEEAAWELSTLTPSRYLRTQRTRLPGLAATDAIVRVLPAGLAATSTGSPHLCCVDRGATTASLLMALCPWQLQPVDALPLRHTDAEGRAHELIATCMERVPARDEDGLSPALASSEGLDLTLIGTCAVHRASPSSAAAPHWLLVLASSPLRVVSAVSVPATAFDGTPAGAGAGIADLAVYRRPVPPPPSTSTSASCGRHRGRPATTTPPAPASDECVLVAVAGGTSVFLYQLYGLSLVLLSKVDCHASCTSISMSYPCISVGLGGDGLAYLWILALSEGVERRGGEKNRSQRGDDRTSRASLRSGEEEDGDGDGDDDSSDDDGEDARAGGAVVPARHAVRGPLPLRSPHSIDDLNAILRRSDTRDALASDVSSDASSADVSGAEASGAEEDRQTGPVLQDDGTTPLNREEERRRRIDQSRLATLHSAPTGLSLVMGACEPTVLSGGTRQRGYRDRFVRTDDRGGVALVYVHPPTSLTQMHQPAVGLRDGTSSIITHSVHLPSPPTSLSVMTPLHCRAVSRAQPRALEWCERWVSLSDAGAGPRAILLPCADGSLHALTEMHYGLAHPLLRLEQILTDLHTHRLAPRCVGDGSAAALHFTYHIKPYAEETALRSATRLVPKQGVVGLNTLKDFFAWWELLCEPSSAAQHPRAVLALESTIDVAVNALFEEYGDELTLQDCEEAVSSV